MRWRRGRGGAKAAGTEPEELMEPLPPRVPEPFSKAARLGRKRRTGNSPSLSRPLSEVLLYLSVPRRKRAPTPQKFRVRNRRRWRREVWSRTEIEGLLRFRLSGCLCLFLFLFNLSVCYQCSSFLHGPSSPCIIPKRVPNSSSRFHLLSHVPGTPGAGFLKGFPGPCSP